MRGAEEWLYLEELKRNSAVLIPATRYLPLIFLTKDEKESRNDQFSNRDRY